MSEFTPEKQEEMLGKVRKLLARADHPNTPEAEAESARTMAEGLMLKYRITEATAIASGSVTMTPIWRTVDLVFGNSEFATSYYQLAGTVMSHIGARGVTGWHYDEESGQHVTHLEWVGYSSDLSYGDMLLTAAMIEFGKRLEPKYDPLKTDEENAWILRSAGWERKRIARELFGDWTTENEMKAKNRKVTALIKKHGEKIGEDWQDLLGRGNNIKVYRQSYAEGFVNTLHTRLWRMRTAQGEESGALVLRSRKENVDEAFYSKFPQYRPKKDGGTWKDPQADCEKCKKAKSGYCREHAYLRPSTRYVKKSTHSAGYDRGRTAANMVDLGPGATGRGRMGGSGPAGTLG